MHHSHRVAETGRARQRILIVLSMLAASLALSLHSPSPVGAEIVGTIVDGERAASGELRYQVVLETENGLFCGGSLIATNAVLTAAHCIDIVGGDASKVTVRSGMVNLNRDGQSRAAEKLVVHPKWTGTEREGGDIAIVFVDEPFTLDAKTQLIDALSSDVGALDTPGTDAIVSGWGSTDIMMGSFPDRLQKRRVTTLSDKACNAFLADRDISIINKQMLCVDGQGGGPCVGDSGGALAVDNDGDAVVIGVVSWGLICGLDGMSGVFTEVDTYRGWIEKRLDKNPPTTPIRTTVFTNKSKIRIPPEGTIGRSFDTMTVEGIGSEIVDVDLVLLGLDHGRPSDLIVGVRGPNHREDYFTTVLLMSGMGGDFAVKGTKIRFDDNARLELSPDELTSGRYRPSSPDPTWDDGEWIELSSIEGTDPNGEWELELTDSRTGKKGKIRGWKLIIRSR